jgi:hypothetical protein
MLVSGLSVLVGMLAMLLSRRGVLLPGIVLIQIVMMGRLKVMVGRCVMMSGSSVMMFTGGVLLSLRHVVTLLDKSVSARSKMLVSNPLRPA